MNDVDAGSKRVHFSLVEEHVGVVADSVYTNVKTIKRRVKHVFWIMAARLDDDAASGDNGAGRSADIEVERKSGAAEGDGDILRLSTA